MSEPPAAPRDLTQSEQLLFQLYVDCSFALKHPRQLYTEYNLTYAELASVAGCTVRTMERWMNREEAPKFTKHIYLRRLGEFYFLLHHYQRIPPEVWDDLCPLPPAVRSRLFSPSE